MSGRSCSRCHCLVDYGNIPHATTCIIVSTYNSIFLILMCTVKCAMLTEPKLGYRPGSADLGRALDGLRATRDVLFEMFNCLNGKSFFIKIVPVDGSPGEKQVSMLRYFQGVYTKIPQAVFFCVSCHKVCCPEYLGFLGFINLFDLTSVRNSLTGTVGISPLTILKKKVSRCCFLLSWSGCSPRSLSVFVSHPGMRYL